MPNIRILLTDLDETLLRSDKTISDRTMAALRRCQDNGILIGFATLRGKETINKYQQMINPDIVICCGGGTVIVNGEVIHQDTFTLEQTRALIAAAYRILGDRCEMNCDTPNGFYWNRAEDKSVNYAEAVYDDMRDFHETACKMSIQMTDDEKARLIAAAAGDIDVAPFSDVPWYKFSPKNATKENGVRILAQHLRIPLSQIAAFGDDYTDIGMLQAAGVGVAMGNAILPVKNAANEITLTNNEDGVADWIEKNVFYK